MNIFNKICHHFSKWAVIAYVIFSSLISFPAQAEEDPASDKTQSLKKLESSQSNLKPLMLSFFIDNQSLIENIKYDPQVNLSKIETLTDGELLILKHNAKNRKKRGNVLFLHTNGESANHHRLVRPLAVQLSQLGWTIFIPNIAKEDFLKPKFGTKRKVFRDNSIKLDSTDQSQTDTKKLANKKTQSKEPTTDKLDKELTNTNETNTNKTDNSDLAKNQYYFGSTDKYQAYIKEICEKISTDPDWLKKPRILILNQTSSYWGLSCLANTGMPTVFLDPQLPLGVKNNLEDIFSKQSSSFYVFYSKLTTNTKMASFSKALSTNQWHSKNQRYSQGILPKGNINIEDTNLAKRITGWAEKLRKNSK